MMSPKSTIYDSTKKPKISVKKSSTDARAGKLGVPYCVGPITVTIYAC